MSVKHIVLYVTVEVKKGFNLVIPMRIKESSSLLGMSCRSNAIVANKTGRLSGKLMHLLSL